jgi:hypothetical protein
MRTILLITLLFAFLAGNSQSTSKERDSVAQTSAFQSKVKLQTHIAASNILADPQQPARVRQYAQMIITEPQGGNWLQSMSFIVMTNPAINWNSSDNDVLFAVNSNFSKMALAYYREQ